MLEFYRTKAGRIFFEGTMPRIVKGLEDLVEAFKPMAQIAEKLYKEEPAVSTLEEMTLDNPVRVMVYDAACQFMFEISLPGIPSGGSMIYIPGHNYRVLAISFYGVRETGKKYRGTLVDIRVEEV